ncbi:hypothetical protein C488_19182 [Natrinema pellirubrum DSM 15624]|uniref:Glycyl aminopeptidase n=1 Tax=Natrinema pellirubrum (strain DSM 15624 / CIP 106293 / JCM 10476 / NCIMB 786 / 157) TaxID=797303 RepID=L0JGP4_NATP1|nr:hypothetical protein [Natrinema pellirubrum]AGB30023.1 hypothetical protein Natpe_0077 [Natrinema pellirubrum DSM 15624]ELY70168.1 hypothetical protein C488_19182 [Natrinema pellirubrum DSM 15624]
MTSRFVTLAFVVLLACSLPAGIAAGTPTDRAPASADLETPSVGAAATGSSSDVLHRTTTLRHRPTDTDVFETETTFRVPDSVTELEIELEQGATVESTTGFERTGERTLEWTGDTDEPTVRYTMPADRTGSQGAGATGEGYSFVDTGEWAVVPVPDVAISLRRTDPVGIEETVRVDGPGATGGDIAFFGAVTERERTVDGERFRLAVPEAATLEESPDAILSALADASGRLEVGARSDEVFVVAVPATVDWGPRGIQYGESDAWVVADEPLDSPNPAWLHEYVHVRQRFANTADGTTTETEWFVEGQADYHAGLLALEAGYTDFEEFSRLLERGTESPYADGALADPGTWEHDRTDYVKGALVAGEIDRQLRVATDGDRTLADVVRDLNADDDAATEAALLGSIETYGGTAVRTDAERYTRTDATPAVWSRTDHRAAFDQSVASFEYGFGTGPIEVAGEEWPRWSASEAGVDAGTDEVIVVPAGESVTVPAAVDNAGDREGTYDLTLGADGRTVAHRQGTLAPGGERSHRLSWTPAEPGTYVLRIGSERLTAVVRSSPSVTVTDLRLEPEAVDPGEPVTATATVEAAGDGPGAAVLAFRTVDGVAAKRPVAVRPDGTATVEAELRFDEASQYEVGVGERTATISVGETGPAAAIDDVPGFGVLATLGAFLLLVVTGLAARRR